MSLIPSFFGNRRSSIFDPFSLDVWDPFKDFPFSSPRALLKPRLLSTPESTGRKPRKLTCSRLMFQGLRKKK
ncbi:hypothetical protein Gohar_015160 [Gossypium harknessii]|uniref:Uncharacterized protein n=1 Tax=Gossypium harknessii TaxID=34285 RepID=A0A7J9FYY7_9ROSI|nr:hypothetical protein [Gossypium harknessii]